MAIDTTYIQNQAKILAEYEAHEAKVKAAIDWVKTQ